MSTSHKEAPAPVGPMPGQLPTESSPSGPRFERPTPSFGQRTSMRLAGAALGLGRNADPHATMETLVTRVGGYQEKENTGSVPTYTHKDSKPKVNAATYDETAKGATVSQYRNGADFAEASTGTTLLGAVRRTVDHSRRAPGRPSARERVATRLVGRATRKGANVYTR